MGLALGLLALILSAAHADDWTLFFADDFERDTIGMDWDLTRGDWRIEEGRLVVTRLPGWSSDSMIHLVRPWRGDMRASFDLTVPGDTMVQVSIRVGEQVWGGGGEPVQAELELVTRRRNEQDTRPLIEVGRTHRITIAYSDAMVRGWVDDQQVLEVPVDPDRCPYNDALVLNCFNDAVIDNVRVDVRENSQRDPLALRPADNARATIDASAFLDPAKPCYGLQDAIDALPAAGGVVIVPEGRFVLRQPLWPRPGVALRGQGRATGQAGEHDSHGAPLVRIEQSHNVLVAEVDLRQGGGTGLEVVASHDVQLRMNRAWRVGTGYIVRGGGNLIVAENQALDCRVDGFLLEAVDGTVAFGSNIAWYARRHGLNVIRLIQPGATIDSNVVTTSGGDGVRLEGLTRAAFTGNVVHNSSLAARGRHAHLRLVDVQETNVRGNRMGDETYDTTIGAAVRETGGSAGNTVRFNVLCPDLWPASAPPKTRIELRAGGNSLASDNVLLAYPAQH